MLEGTRGRDATTQVVAADLTLNNAMIEEVTKEDLKPGRQLPSSRIARENVRRQRTPNPSPRGRRRFAQRHEVSLPKDDVPELRR